MTPPMYQRVSDLLEGAGLFSGFTIQRRFWDDTGKGSDRFIVIRPNGGSAVDRDMASDHYVMLDVISAVSGDYVKAEAVTQAIIDWVQQNPLNPCVGQISNMGGMPSPILTAEKRMVWRLQFSCLYGG